MKTENILQTQEEKQDLQQELELSKKRLAYALEQTNISVWEYDMKKHKAYQSVHSQRCGNHQSVYTNFPQCLFDSHHFYGDSEEKARQLYARVEAGEPLVMEDLKIDDGKGSHWWEKNTYHVLRDDSGEPFWAIAVGVDVTEQKKIEERYVHETVYSRELSDETIGMAFVVNVSSGVLERWIKCPDGLDCTDYDELVSIVLELVLEDYREEFQRTFSARNFQKQLRDGNNTVEMTYGRKYRKGVNYFHTTAKLYRRPFADECMATVISRDITSQFLYKKMVETVISTVYSYIVRVDGQRNTYEIYSTVKKGHTVEVLENFEEARYNYVMKTCDDSDPGKKLLLRLASVKEMCAYLDLHGEYQENHRMLTKNGEKRLCQVRIMYIDKKNRQICLLSTDITDSIRVEEKKRAVLREALDMARQANEAKSVFLSSMSHDMRTPMNAIMGMTKMALEDVENTENVHKSLRIIEDSSKQLLGLINNILDMSRIESGKLRVEAEEYSHFQELQRFMKYMEPLALKKNQEICWDYSGIIHERCFADSTRIRQILQNLVGNSIKFTPEKGKITVTVEEHDYDSEGLSIFRYRVADTGKGMDKETVAHVFEPFYREPSMEVNQIEGSGLGLSIVKNLVEAQGGTINVESEPGKGSVFTVELPMRVTPGDGENHPEDSEACQEQTVTYDFKGVHVLLVEDHPINIVVAEKLLEKVGAAVTTAENGQEGLQIFTESGISQFDIILMDIQMPVMDGYEATRRIRACGHMQAKTIPIIAMTANAYVEDKENCLKAGMDGHVAKPIDPDVLYRTLEDVLYNCGLI